MASRATSPLPGLMISLCSPGSRRPRPPRHMPTRQVAHAGRRRPACALLPLRANCVGATRLRGLGAAAVARLLALPPLPFARGVRRPRWCARGAAAAVLSSRRALNALLTCSSLSARATRLGGLGAAAVARPLAHRPCLIAMRQAATAVVRAARSGRRGAPSSRDIASAVAWRARELF